MSEIRNGETISIRVLLFGHCRTLVGRDELALDVPAPATAGGTLEAAFAFCPALEALRGKLIVAVNENYALPDDPVHTGDEVAIFPPVSGGQGTSAAQSDPEIVVDITHDRLDAGALAARLLRGRCGAVVTFDGVVRDNTKGRKTKFLDYEAYVPMALKMMRRIAEETKAGWPVDRVGILHRLGRLEIGESSVVIVVTSPHRGVAFEACRHAIDRVKQSVPIWKREYFEDGEIWVEGEIPPETQAR